MAKETTIFIIADKYVSGKKVARHRDVLKRLGYDKFIVITPEELNTFLEEFLQTGLFEGVVPRHLFFVINGRPLSTETIAILKSADMCKIMCTYLANFNNELSMDMSGYVMANAVHRPISFGTYTLVKLRPESLVGDGLLPTYTLPY